MHSLLSLKYPLLKVTVELEHVVLIYEHTCVQNTLTAELCGDVTCYLKREVQIPYKGLLTYLLHGAESFLRS